MPSNSHLWVVFVAGRALIGPIFRVKNARRCATMEAASTPSDFTQGRVIQCGASHSGMWKRTAMQPDSKDPTVSSSKPSHSVGQAQAQGPRPTIEELSAEGRSCALPKLSRIDPATGYPARGVPTSTGSSDTVPTSSQAAGATPNRKKQSKRRRPDPLVQSFMLLLTMGVMLAAARFAVPSIVEEIRYAWYRGELRAEYEAGADGLKNVSLDALSDAYQMVTAVVGPSVVHIEVQRRPQLSEESIIESITSPPLSDQGSGVIVDDQGYLLTNRHVVAEGEDIIVTLSDGRRVTATIVGSDPLTDLAVLKVDADQLIPIKWGDSDRCRVGSPVWAVGSPFGLDRTVTFGILSGKHRMVRASTQYQDFMQSDVAVNPGNSGGPLVDARGTLVGINTAIVGDTYQGVSFSVPSNVVRQVYERIRETGRVDRGWLGVALLEVNDDDVIGDNPRVRGAAVREITGMDSPAAMAGLKTGDLILRVDDQPIRDTAHLMRTIGACLAGTSVSLDVARSGERLEVEVELGTRPEFLNRRR